MSLFKKAEKSGLYLRMGLVGPSGSGKTYQALLLASSIVDDPKIAVIDTENNSASLYSDEFKFDVAQLEPPYSVEKYLRAMQECANAGYNVLIIDSLSHAWAGEGGILDQKTRLDARGGNSFTNWGMLTPVHEKLKNAILHPKFHLIVTMRVKQDYVIEQNEKGKSVPKKVGLAPVQREGMEYELDLVFDLAMDHSAIASKDRTKLFSSTMPFVVDRSTGERIKSWLGGGPTTPPPAETPKPKNGIHGSGAATRPLKNARREPTPASSPQGNDRVVPGPFQKIIFEVEDLDLNDKVLAWARDLRIGFGPHKGKQMGGLPTSELVGLLSWFENKVSEGKFLKRNGELFEDKADFIKAAAIFVRYSHENELLGYTAGPLDAVADDIPF